MTRPSRRTSGGFGIISLMSSPKEVEDDLLLERQLCFALTAASRTVISAYRPVLQELDLTHPQYLVMLALWERSPRSVKDISAELLLGPATLSPLLKRLEAAGYLTRKRLPKDERSLAVSNAGRNGPSSESSGRSRHHARQAGPQPRRSPGTPPRHDPSHPRSTSRPRWRGRGHRRTVRPVVCHALSRPTTACLEADRPVVSTDSLQFHHLTGHGPLIQPKSRQRLEEVDAWMAAIQDVGIYGSMGYFPKNQNAIANRRRTVKPAPKDTGDWQPGPPLLCALFLDTPTASNSLTSGGSSYRSH